MLLTQLRRELEYPFKDPRVQRADSSIETDDQLLLHLIDETPESFRKGAIVTATVKTILSGGNKPKVICRLESDLLAEIDKSIITNDAQHKLEDLLQIGQSLLARIAEITAKDNNGSKEFFVKLDCRQTSLESHRDYIPEIWKEKHLDIPEEDLRNLSFQPREAGENQGIAQARRIRHNKFSNSNCSQALNHLARKPTGDFLFRPSRRDNRLTLTWKVWENCYSHIEVEEHNRGPTDVIGRTLVMQGQNFQGLTDI